MTCWKDESATVPEDANVRILFLKFHAELLVPSPFRTHFDRMVSTLQVLSDAIGDRNRRMGAMMMGSSPKWNFPNMVLPSSSCFEIWALSFWDEEGDELNWRPVVVYLSSVACDIGGLERLFGTLWWWFSFFCLEAMRFIIRPVPTYTPGVPVPAKTKSSKWCSRSFRFRRRGLSRYVQRGEVPPATARCQSDSDSDGGSGGGGREDKESKPNNFVNDSSVMKWFSLVNWPSDRLSSLINRSCSAGDKEEHDQRDSDSSTGSSSLLMARDYNQNIQNGVGGHGRTFFFASYFYLIPL